MVGHRDVQMERENTPQERDRHDHRLQCITAGMGSPLQNANHKGSMVTEGGSPPHQILRIAGSNISSTVICKKQIKAKHSAENRQHHSSCLYQSSGGTVSRELVSLTKDLWMWCLERNIRITVQHLPGSQNTIADAESKSQTDRTDWKLLPMIFHRIQETFGPLEVDLFVTRLSTLSAHATSASGQIHLQRKQMHSSTSRGTPAHLGIW